MELNYKTRGSCARGITITLSEDYCITSVRFIGGCKGNTSAIAQLVTGQNARDVIPRLKGILCRNGTSCPDQLALALESLLQGDDTISPQEHRGCVAG
ncbi:MAG: TIGR03905 family TSCPD domain-containing protein [Desulfuromonadaceae bacterium]|nr:TIGR03905 family TSCPD domain-containing protein [Desulfuromonadaceae bacterium]